MLKSRFLREHRAWEDWVVIALGIAVVLAPWVTNETANPATVINAAAVGLALMMLAELDLVHFRRWLVLGQLACGVWTALSPFAFGYAGSGELRFWHLSAGSFAVLLCGLELRQHRLRTPASNEAKPEAAGQTEQRQ